MPKPGSVIGFDTETNIVRDLPERKLYVITLGTQDWQVVIDTLRAPEYVMQWARDIISHPHIMKIAHNMSFDAQTMWLNNVTVVNAYDTMLAEIILNNGKLKKMPSLAELAEARTFMFMDKSIRTTYNGEELNEEQIWYAAKDVRPLVTIWRQQYLELHQENLLFTAGLEMETVLAMARMEFDGIRIDKERWLDVLRWTEEEYDKKRHDLEDIVWHDEKIKAMLVSKGMLIEEDKVTINWNSHQTKMAIARHFFPPLTGLSKPILMATIKAANENQQPEAAHMFLQALNGNWQPMEEYIIRTDSKWLVDNGYMLKAGTCTVNWNSAPQMKEIGVLLAPRLKSMEAKYIRSRDHPFFKTLVEYNEWQKRVGTYGASFLDHTQCDERIRTRWIQMVETGRTASQNPNMQNIPARGIVKDRYRRAFVPEPNNVFVGSDFSGQEIVLSAYIFKEPIWLEAIRKKEDLHSIVAEMVFEKNWHAVERPDCAYKKSRQKCDCPGHKPLRDKVKTISFGLIYGMTEVRLADELGINRNEAIELRMKYFSKLPAIQRSIKRFQTFGVRNGYTMTIAPFYRKRWFPYWHELKNMIPSWESGVYDHPTLGEMARQSGNTPIQGTGADMIKVALCLCYDHLRRHNLLGTIKLNLLVHDELLTECPKEMAEEWKSILYGYMKDAGRLFIPEGLIDADTKISEQWTK